MSKDTRTRAHEHELTLDAPLEAVWTAITDAHELIRWFPMQAQVSPGPGGRIVYAWPPDFEGACEIETWDPPRHLRTSWAFLPSGATEDQRRRVAVDWILEGRGGTTVLRLVHSGFDLDASWDEEYDGTRRGWNHELRSLKHYLERHRGEDRRAIWVRRPANTDAATAWARLNGPDGFGREGSLADARAGERLVLTTAAGDRFEGTVLMATPGKECAFTVQSLDDGLVRIALESFDGRLDAHVWVSGWGTAAAEADALAQRCKAILERIFP